MSNWFTRFFTLPHKDTVKLNAFLGENPEILQIVNDGKQAAAQTLASAITAANATPEEYQLSGILASILVERAIPTNHVTAASVPAITGSSSSASVPASSSAPSASVASLVQQTFVSDNLPTLPNSVTTS
jgi:hypothetical protein